MERKYVRGVELRAPIAQDFYLHTHSPILIVFPDAEILEITESGIQSVTYRETEHYLLTRYFLEQPSICCGICSKNRRPLKKVFVF